MGEHRAQGDAQAEDRFEEAGSEGDAAGTHGEARAAPASGAPSDALALDEKAAEVPRRAAEVEDSRSEGGAVLASLAEGPDAPVSLASLVQPSADDRDAAIELGPQVSTILGPLPVGVPVKKTRDLNDAVHGILVIGLVVSTVLLIIGLGLELLQTGTLPTQTLAAGEAFQRALSLRPSGFVSLGLLALMFTPIVRVIGSVIVFIWERDRLYAAITLIVLVVMVVSVLIGHG